MQKSIASHLRSEHDSKQVSIICNVLLDMASGFLHILFFAEF